jgi:hypothetical protein
MMNKGRNSARADFGPRTGATTRAQRPKWHDGPSQPARGAHTQRTVTVLRTGAAGGVGNGNDVGRSDGAEHHWGRASPLGKVANGGTHRCDTAMWRRRRSFDPAVFVGNARRTAVGGGSGVS